MNQNRNKCHGPCFSSQKQKSGSNVRVEDNCRTGGLYTSFYGQGNKEAQRSCMISTAKEE